MNLFKFGPYHKKGKFTAAFKVKVAMEALKGQSTIAEKLGAPSQKLCVASNGAARRLGK